MPSFGSRAAPIERRKPQPAEARQLCCPNPECQRSDRLEVIEQARVTTSARFTDVGVTYPEIDYDYDTEDTSPDRRQLLGLRCGACRWSYEGPDPLARLGRPA